MAIKAKHIWVIVCLIFLSLIRVHGIPPVKPVKNVLLINSYHQGYLWTDSLTSGIIQALKSNPEITLHVKNLNSKQFGNKNFEVEKNYFKLRFSEIKFDGVLVTDNDALDFAFKYDKELFPNTPVVFAGISNPDDYLLTGSQYYGFKETASIENVLQLVRKILPESNRLLVLTDHTTTGQIYRKEFEKQAAQMGNFSVRFPNVINLDTIFRMVSSEKDYDAIYYIGINQDDNGQLVDFVPILDKICQIAQVPVFNNDPISNGKGVIGGLYQSGKKHGFEAARLLVRLMDSTQPKPAQRYGTTGFNYYFDWKILAKYNIPPSRTPEGSHIINKPNIVNTKYILGLIGALTFLVLIILILSWAVRKAKIAEKKINQQYKKIHHQKKQLEKAYEQLSGVINELEKTNRHLNETNVNLLEAKKKAEESDNLKSAFLANVSHEIRTPLNSIVGFSSLLGEPDLSQEQRNTYIELIESNTESLLVLIDEILDLSKIEAQQLTFKKQNFSIDEMISELLQTFNHAKTNNQLALKIGQSIDGKLLSVFSDRVRVKQIFTNLISNAFKFTDKGSVEVGYFLSGNKEIVFYVKDTGIGIKKEHHHTIFNRFFKINDNSSKIYRGTGLGLSITQKLVELLGGKIWIESEPGNGSTFFFTLQDCVLTDRLD